MTINNLDFKSLTFHRMRWCPIITTYETKLVRTFTGHVITTFTFFYPFCTPGTLYKTLPSHFCLGLNLLLTSFSDDMFSGIIPGLTVTTLELIIGGTIKYIHVATHDTDRDKLGFLIKWRKAESSFDEEIAAKMSVTFETWTSDFSTTNSLYLQDEWSFQAINTEEVVLITTSILSEFLLVANLAFIYHVLLWEFKKIN